MKWLRKWWCTRVQRDIATALGALAVLDLTPYADDIREFIPWTHWHAALRLTGAIAMFWRATQVSQRKGDDDEHPEPTDH